MALANGQPFVFFDRNATLDYSEPYTDRASLNEIAWDLLMESPQLDGYCKYSDNDNDSWIMHFTDRVADGVPRGTFEFVAGSGKFDGATIQGEILPANGFPAPAQPGVLNRYTRVTGTYKLR